MEIKDFNVVGMDNQEKIINIIKQIEGLLHARPKDMVLIDFLKSIFVQYSEKLASLDDIIARPKMLKEGLIETTEKVEERIYQSLEYYFNGRLLSAIAEMDFLFQDLELILPKGYNQYSMQPSDIWYRGRVRNKGIRMFSTKEMFHIPNHLRENVSNQRFSFNGYPCLYMGKSIWTCWEELDEPHLDDICFSAIKISKDIHLFDLSIPTADSIRDKSIVELISLLVTLPIKIACSIKTRSEKANFKEEYIIPQLLMIELIEHSDYDGYIFTSTKGNPTFGWHEKYLLNAVLPVRGNFDNDGLCVSLKEKMHITEPVCHQYEILKSTISDMIPVSSEEIDAMFEEDGHETKEADSDIYPRTVFGQMEDVLKESEFVVI